MGIWRIPPDPEIVMPCDARGCRAELDTWHEFRRMGKFSGDHFRRGLELARMAGWETGLCNSGHYHLCPEHSLRR